MTVSNNPVRITIQDGPGGPQMGISLTPDAIGLRARYRKLVLHLHNAPEPLIWDLGTDMALQRSVPCLGAPARICMTVYGMLGDGNLRLIFRNWGAPGDGLG